MSGPHTCYHSDQTSPPCAFINSELYLKLLMSRNRASEMVYRVKVLVAKSYDLSLIPRIHIVEEEK